MKIPCADRLPFIVTGLAFLKPILTAIQYENLTMIATALILGGVFNLSTISRMWLKDKGVSTLSHFLAHGKFSTNEMRHLYALQVQRVHKLGKGYYLVDDTLQHHTKFCRFIHGVSLLFDHAMGTNLKAVCVVFLYWTDGDRIRFPIDFAIFYQKDNCLPWRKNSLIKHQTKYELALQMLAKALARGFPLGVVLADSWYGMEPFIQGLKLLRLDYVVEIKSSAKVRIPARTPRLTPTGRLAKKQYDVQALAEFFESMGEKSACGLAADLETGKAERILYETKLATARLNAIPGKHRLVASNDPKRQTSKYFLTNQLTWEAHKILEVYSHRWVIEEFFRNAKQLTDMEGATIRSEQGVTLALCLVSWLDFLLHYESYRPSIAFELPKEALTLPSIVRQAQHQNLKAVIEKVVGDEEFRLKWLAVERASINRNRKPRYELVKLEESGSTERKIAA